jgi:CDP-glucose 4,6-dehydratase
MLDRSFWTGRKVFVTGHTGYKGSWLSLWLHTLGADVTGYSLEPPTQPNLFTQARIAHLVRSIHGDIRDFSKTSSAITACQPEVVIHMAAQSVVRRGYQDPIETYSTNVMGTVHIFEAVRALNAPCIVLNVTSDKCYENKEWAWGYRETDSLGGHDPYSNSKACAELVTSAFRDSYFCTGGPQPVSVSVATARAGNVIGGGDWTADQLIPDLMRAFLESKPCKIRNPHAVRPWQFVLEPLRGYLMLIERLSSDRNRFASAWNFGPAQKDAKPVSWIANELVRLWGNEAKWAHDAEAHPREAHYLRLDTSWTESALDWHPAITLNVALDWVAEWYHAFQSGDDLGRLTRAQIERYESFLKN